MRHRQKQMRKSRIAKAKIRKTWRPMWHWWMARKGGHPLARVQRRRNMKRLVDRVVEASRDLNISPFQLQSFQKLDLKHRREVFSKLRLPPRGSR